MPSDPCIAALGEFELVCSRQGIARTSRSAYELVRALCRSGHNALLWGSPSLSHLAMCLCVLMQMMASLGLKAYYILNDSSTVLFHTTRFTGTRSQTHFPSFGA